MIRYKKYKTAKNKIVGFFDKSENHLIIHYSCEGFYDKDDGRTPRITSIAVRYLNSSQTKSFSIHKVAEREKGLQPIDNIENRYDEFEKKMLCDFFCFVERHLNFVWLHWNMRDENFGFYAIENRYKVLGGTPISIPDDKKVDIARLLVDRYGKYYIENPKMVKLVEKNNMTKMDFLTGAEEAEAFDNKEYIKLHKSTLRKVDLFTSILTASSENTLLTNSKWKDIYGMSPQGIYEKIKESWIFYIITTILSIMLGVLIRGLLN